MISIETRQEAVRQYRAGAGSPTIAKNLGVSVFWVLKVVEAAGIKRGLESNGNRKSARYDAFTEVVDEPTAYWLGFLLADGGLSRGRQVTLCIKDLDHLICFKKWMQSEHDIIPDRASFRISFTHQGLADDLKALKFIQNKSLILEFPDIPMELERHLVRGYFDGDGSVSLYEWHSTCGRYARPTCCLSICCGSRIFIDRCAAILGLTVISHKKKYWVAKTSAKDKLLSAYHVLYDGATIFLPRKHDRLIEYLS